MKTSKANLIGDILVQDLYMPDSGMYRIAEKALYRLSRNELESLTLIILNKQLQNQPIKRRIV